MRTSILLNAILGIAITAACVAEASGQALKKSPEALASVTVIADDRLPPESSVVVVRRTNLKPHNIILVRSADVVPNDFVGALHSIRMLMIRDGIVPQRDTRMSPHFTSTGSRSAIDSLRTALKKLLTAPIRSVAGFEDRRSVDVDVPLDNGRFLGKGLSRRTGVIPPETEN